MTNGHKLLEHLMDSFDLRQEPIPGLPLAEIAGECRVLIENHCGVIKYGCNEIVIKVRFGCYSIKGSGLKLIHMTKERLVIRGNIDCVSILRRR